MTTAERTYDSTRSGYLGARQTEAPTVSAHANEGVARTEETKLLRIATSRDTVRLRMTEQQGYEEVNAPEGLV